MSPYTLPAMGALLVAAAAFGVHLGESAVAQIDPAHFRGPAIHPRDRGAAIDEQAHHAAGPRFAALYGWDEGSLARAADCGDCEALAARDRDVGLVVRVETAAFTAPPPPRPAAPKPAPPPALEVEWKDIERYAYYPVSAEEAEAYAAYSE